MPLPDGDIAWPPKQLDGISPFMDLWSAWYAGDPDQLDAVYQGRKPQRFDRASQYRGGVVGTVARMFWGRPRGDLTQPASKLHAPIAADICQASADLLFSEPVSLTVKDPKKSKATQERLDEWSGETLHTVLAEGAEVGAALGGVYMRVTWDRDIRPDGPFVTAVHADQAWPEFRWGMLTAVTLWKVIEQDDQRVVRHLERHEMINGVGWILHGLYEGTKDKLGRKIPLSAVSSLAGIDTATSGSGAISTESAGLAVEYVPNQRPQPRWRTHPLGSNLGRSDLDGVEQMMDALDEVYTSWIRDIRLGKARILVAASLLESLGPGRGAMFDTDQEIYSPVNALPSRESSGLPIEQAQFAIRVEEHRATAQELTEVILRKAGYSAQTFGEGEASGAITATEVESRERRSFLTRDRKIRLWRPAIVRLVTKMLAVDRAIFQAGGIEIEPPEVAFGDSVQDSPRAVAETVNLLHQAEAASTEVKVGMVHPDWADEQIQEEVQRIKDQTGASVTDPTMGRFPPPAPDQQPADDPAVQDDPEPAVG